MTHKKNIDITILNTEPNYPKDTQFLAQYIILANKYNITLGEYNLLKLEKFTKMIITLKDENNILSTLL